MKLRETATRVADSSILRDDLIDEIEKALNAERERCAKIAETHEGHGEWCSSAAGDCQSLTVKAIAAAIRGKD